MQNISNLFSNPYIFIYNSTIKEPYTSAYHHYEAVFSSNLAVPPSLSGRVKHLVWAVLESIPVINIIVTLFDKYLARQPLSNESSKQEIATETPSLTHNLPISSKPSLFPADEVIEEPASPLPTASKKEWIIFHQKKRVYEQFSNPYFLANATRIQGLQYQNNYSFCEQRSKDEYPLVKIVLSENIDLERIEKILVNPLFEGLNLDCFHVKNSSNDPFDFYKKHTLLEHAIATKNQALFDLTLSKGRNLKFRETALLEAIHLGIEGEYYISQLLNARTPPPSETMISSARERGLSESIICKLEARKILHLIEDSNSTQGLSALHKAILGLEVDEVRRLVEEKNFFLELKSSDKLARDLRSCTPLEVAVKIDPTSSPYRLKEIISILLENGASANFQSLFQIIQWSNHCEDELAIRMLNSGADPFKSGHQGRSLPILAIESKFPSKHPIRKQIDMLYPGMTYHFWNQMNLSTLWEINFFFKHSYYSGGNWVKNLFPLLSSTLKAIREHEFKEELSLFPSLDTETRQKLDSCLVKSVNYANELLTRQDVAGWADEIRMNSQQFPVILPVSSSGHASSIIIWKDLIIQANQGATHLQVPGYSKTNPGIDIYQCNLSGLTDEHLHLIISNPNIAAAYTEQPLNTAALIDNFALNVDPTKQLISHIDTKGQTTGNCAWSSSALLGLQVAIEAVRTEINRKEFQLSCEGNLFIEDFNMVAKLTAVRNYLQNIQENQKSEREQIDLTPIRDILCKCLLMLIQKESKHQVLLEKTVDDIICSGLPIKLDENDFRDLLKGVVDPEIKNKWREMPTNDQIQEEKSMVDKAKQRLVSLVGVDNWTDVCSLLAGQTKEQDWALKKEGR